MNPASASPSPIGAELVTPRLDVARDFYGALFDWTFGTATDGLTAYAEGVAVADLRRGSTTSRWWSVFGADDPVGVRAAAERAGARVAGDEVHDPLGASFLLRARVAVRAPGPGRPCWYEYMTEDAVAADRFHADALGLRAVVPDGAPDGSYALLVGESGPVAGRLLMPPPLRARIPAGWMVYIAVADPDDVAERAPRLGARVLVPASDVVTGRVCALADPTGAVLTVIRPAPVTR